MPIQRLSYKTVTIANGQSLSPAVDLEGYVIAAIQMPAAWTAANITFQATADGATFQDVFDQAGVEVSVTAAAARFIHIEPTKLRSFSTCKLRSGTTGTPVAQGAQRDIILALRPE